MSSIPGYLGIRGIVRIQAENYHHQKSNKQYNLSFLNPFFPVCRQRRHHHPIRFSSSKAFLLVMYAIVCCGEGCKISLFKQFSMALVFKQSGVDRDTTHQNSE